MSEVISDRIKILYSQYQDCKIVPTSAQTDFITKLGGNPERSATSIEAQKQIRFLLGNRKITPKQQELLHKLSKDSIDTILKRDVVIEDVTRFELSRIMNSLQNRRKLNPKVYNHPIIIQDNYEYGWQESDKCPDNKLYYIVFYDLLMVDIDGSSIDLNQINLKLILLDLIGRIYRTYNGYHIFITSWPINHKSSEAKKIMAKLGCDLYYMTFSYLNGYKVRLNPKIGREEIRAADFVSISGIGTEDLELVSLLTLHDKYVEQHKSRYTVNDDSSSITGVQKISSES